MYSSTELHSYIIPFPHSCTLCTHVGEYPRYFIVDLVPRSFLQGYREAFEYFSMRVPAKPFEYE